MTTLDDVGLVELRATAHVLGWNIGETRLADLQDDEIRACVAAGLLVIVDPAVRDLVPLTPPTTSRRGCGCGSR